jgi:uncharacterized protein YfaS (alpha-2-macroglobulin family)
MAAVSGAGGPEAQQKPKAAVSAAKAPTPAPVRTPAPAPATWAEVDRLVNEQKFEEASRIVDTLLASAKARKDSADWTKALIRSVQIRTGLHGYETAVRFLKDEPWPPDLLSRTALDLFYAQALVNYAQMYSWEVSRRERVESSGKVDLKAWTREQIYGEAIRAYVAIWKNREALGASKVKALAEFIEGNDYPPGIRDTLRDSVAYFFAALLADTSGWSPAQSNAVFALDLAGLLRADAASTAAVKLDDPAVHPAERLVAVLADLEGWHASRGEKEAAFEARLERLRRLQGAFSEDEDREAITRDLEARLPAMSKLPWYAMGQAQLAELREHDDAPDALVRAREAADAGLAAFPGSVGGRRCEAIAARIQAPAYHLYAMRIDAAKRRSILVTHKNVARLHFRAYALDLPERIQATRDMNRLLPQRDDLEKILSTRTPAAEWSVALPATPDYREHRTYVVPPMEAKGLYVVAASGGQRFSGGDAPVSAASYLVSDLVLVTAQAPRPASASRSGNGGGTLDVRALSGATGRPIAGVSVELLRGEWSPERIARVSSGATDANGIVNLPVPADDQRGRRFLYARHGSDLALDLDTPYWTASEPPDQTTAALVFTDRSIYRPQQKVLWKVLGYRGNPREGRFAVYPRASVTVSLYDQNNQAVESRAVTTNDFGTAAGEFAIPSGRALGSWRVETSLTGSASIRVEEYKRPTFEVTLKDPAEPLRLNRPARLTGEARYYFGLPVASGSVRWRVERTPSYPDWYWWRGWGGPSQTETVAAGESALQADGTFTLAFTPAADERLSESRRGIRYSYSIHADASDEGGETRSASRTFRLGFIAVEARIQLPGGFLRAGREETITLLRTNLDGVPRAGRGSWRIVRLDQPATVALPAELPPDPSYPARPEGGFRTPGDGERARWETQYVPERVMASWKDGREVARGDVTHDEKGSAAAVAPDLAPGAYRLLYSTRDEFGAELQVPRDFVVAGGGKSTPLALAAELAAEQPSVPVGGTARLLVTSGIPGQTLLFEIDRDGRPVERRTLVAGESPSVIEIPIEAKHRGGFGVKLTMLRDHQLVTQTQSIFVPWDDEQLKVSFSTFRDTLRPGQRETWTVKVDGPKGAPLESAAAELLAYMYDRSLDAFVGHNPASPLSLYPNRTEVAWSRSALGQADFQHVRGQFPATPSYPSLRADSLKLYGGYAMGGPGRRGAYAMAKMASVADAAAPVPASVLAEKVVGYSEGETRQNAAKEEDKGRARGDASSASTDTATLRSDFSETAFWKPQLLTGRDGSVSIEFTVPDSVTSWNVWVHAVTKDLKSGSVHTEAKTVKDLMVRPYVPRFLREGDLADLKVVVNNASDRGLSGKVMLDIVDLETSTSALVAFGLSPERATQAFSAAAGAGADVTFKLTTPKRVGSYAIEARAVSGDLSDGERRPVPVLPGRMQLAQSRFAALKGGETRTLRFADMAAGDDPSRIDEQIVVTIDGQLFYSVLSALPYLVNYPYECTEQTLNRFLSTGIVSSVFKDYPAVAAMAQEMAKRDVQLEPWAGDDPNRRMALEETPWLVTAQGGKPGADLTRVLDPRIAKADRETSLAKLRKAQTQSGGFPWWPGGPPSEYMTLYILSGFAHALEFGVDVPKDMAQAAWRYAGAEIRKDLDSCMAHKGTCEYVTFVNYVLSSYPDSSWYAPAFDAAYRKTLLDYSFAHWKGHSPYLKGQLALTLKRAARPKDAKLVWDAVMDAAKTDQDLGTYFAPEDRSWLWYNDTIETQAFALRVLAELEPSDSRRHGLVQWLFLNKKMNQWKSTRATAEVIYALVYYLRKEGALAVREEVVVDVASQKTTFAFEPDRYTGKRNQVVVPGEKIDPKRDSAIEVAKTGKGLAFASATWHFSTEKLPEEDRGDFFAVSRKYFLRESTPSGFVLKPLSDGTKLQAGDEIEVQISLRAKHAAEYVHLRDPRPAGAEPQNVLSRYKWDLGIFWYEETRDSGSNFFFEQLPAGEYTFKHRIRASMAGTFKVAPATVQSMYAPEFHAYSAGAVLTIR